MPYVSAKELKFFEQKIKDYRASKCSQLKSEGQDALQFLSQQFALDVSRGNFCLLADGQSIPIRSADPSDQGMSALVSKIAELKQKYPSYPELKHILQFTQQEMLAYHVEYVKDILNPSVSQLREGAVSGAVILNASDNLSFVIAIDSHGCIEIKGSARAKEFYFLSIDGQHHKIYLPTSDADDKCEFIIQLNKNCQYNLTSVNIPDLNEYTCAFGDCNMPAIKRLFPPLQIHFDVEQVHIKSCEAERAYKTADRNRLITLEYLCMLESLDSPTSQTHLDQAKHEFYTAEKHAVECLHTMDAMHKNLCDALMRLAAEDGKVIEHQQQQVKFYEVFTRGVYRMFTRSTKISPGIAHIEMQQPLNASFSSTIPATHSFELLDLPEVTIESAATQPSTTTKPTPNS